jgi:hypothetical protein
MKINFSLLLTFINCDDFVVDSALRRLECQAHDNGKYATICIKGGHSLLKKKHYQ